MYNLTYSLLADGTFLDGITNVFQLQVIDGNYYGSGEVPPSSHALCLLDANWSQQLLQN
jgi:lipopolysaccharide transport system ATP-binding protein